MKRRNTLYVEEMSTLEAQRTAVAKDRDVVERELKRIRGLIERGLTTAPQSIVLERSLAQIERETQEIETQALRARQQISISEQSIGTLRDEYRTEAAADLATVQAELREIGPRRAAALRMVTDGGSLLGAEAQAEGTDPLDDLVFEITRSGKNGPQRMEATETTLLQPGDILKVRKQETGQPAQADAAAHEALHPVSVSAAEADQGSHSLR